MTEDGGKRQRKGKIKAESVLPKDFIHRMREQQSAGKHILDAMQPLDQLKDQARPVIKMLEVHRPALQQVSKLFETADRSPMAKLDLRAMGLTKPILDMGKLNAAMGLSATQRLDVAALKTSSFAPSFIKEMQRFQATLAGFTQSSAIAALARQVNTNISVLSDALRASALALRPFGEAFARMAEEQKTANFILELGFVPHDELWAHIVDMQGEEDGSSEDRAARIAVACWPRLCQDLALSDSDCLNDQKLAALYQQMLASHEAERYEIVLTGLPTALERCVRLAVTPGSPRKLFQWIRDDVGELPMPVIGGIRGFRVWKIIVEHTLANFQTDQDADAIKYPNRHVVAHGAGSQPAGVVQSLNAILLTHFVIRLARAVINHREGVSA